MTVRVAEDAAARVCDYADRFAVLVAQPSDVVGALEALREARDDIVALADEEHRIAVTISPAVPVPDGALLLVENLRAPYEMLRRVPEAIAARVAERVEYATVRIPETGGVLDDLDEVAGAVVLRLFPKPAGAATRIPLDWLDVAGDWISSGLGDLDTVRIRVLDVEFRVPATDAVGVLHDATLAHAWCDAVHGDLTDRIRTASVTYGRMPHVALAAGGPGADRAGLVARFELLADVARELAPSVAYACIAFEDTFEGLTYGLSSGGWRSTGGAAPNLVASELVDLAVPDAFPFQVLGPDHVARAPEVPGEPLGDDRMEVAIGDPSDWLSLVRDDVQEEGWDLLGALLLDDEDARTAAASRPRPPRDDGAATTSPDLDAIVLEPTAHRRRGTRLTVLELASWLAHERHSDQPTTVAPVLACFAREVASGLDDANRQRLKRRADRLLGTARDRDLAAHEHRRRWLAADWLVRTQAAYWLAAAEVSETSTAVDELSPIHETAALVRAVDLMGNALVTVGRRFDLTAALATDSADPDPSTHAAVVDVVWDVWERVAGGSAWIAASETATVGVPQEVLDATNQRVIEISRDSRARDALDAARASASDAAWATALHAVADHAWRRAWHDADEAAAELAPAGVGQSIEDAIAGTLQRLDVDDDAYDDAAEAARQLLTRAALHGPGEQNPWDAALDTARNSEHGAIWTAVLEDLRATLGDPAWDAAMYAARESTAAVLRDAADVVGRVVAATLGAEVAAAAARLTAVRAAAVAVGHGADEIGIETAATKAVLPVASRLRESALRLLDEMLVPTEPIRR